VKTVTCSCGYVAAGETADELLAAVEAHIDAAHSQTQAAPARKPGDVPITTTEAKR
jgi:predicted small metal-binding protein